MKANELRIGNRVSMGNVYTTEVTLEIIKGAYKFKAIPLTEEWLLKFGVKWIDETGYGDIDGNYHFRAKKFKNGRIDIWINSILVYRNRIKHVHQLQNLYFALTGEELKIKQR